jgi:hypothetical protein
MIAESDRRPQGMVVAAVVVGALVMLVGGVWSWAAPTSFAAAVNFPEHEHFLHDMGAFQLGIAVMLLSALVWRDVFTVVLVGAVFTNGLHAVNHAMDSDLGGRAYDPWTIGLVAVIALVGLVVRVRALRRS